MNKILFLDVDGPMIPGRAYMLPGQESTYEGPLAGFVNEFDPVAVSMINHLCEERGWKIVLHSSRIRINGGQATMDHCIKQGIAKKHFHDVDPFCEERETWRYTRIAKWLNVHSECDQYAILDDEPYSKDIVNHYKHPQDILDHLVLVDFEDGLLMKHYRKLRDDVWHRVLDQ